MKKAENVEFKALLKYLHPPQHQLSSNGGVSSPKYLAIHITKDLTRTEDIQGLSKETRLCLYHLRQLKKFLVSSVILRTFILAL